VHGNEILAGHLSAYDPAARFKQSSHTWENIALATQKMFPDQIEGSSVILTQLGRFMVLDALIGNVDRHHENWGLLWEVAVDHDDFRETVKLTKEYVMAPSYDHGSSLGRELSDEKRIHILRANGVKDYIRKGHGGIYETGAKKGANPLGLVESTARKHPEFFQNTLSKLRDVSLDDLITVLDHVPSIRISQPAKDFAKAMLSAAYTALLRIEL
jgi:hypothetical protein